MLGLTVKWTTSSLADFPPWLCLCYGNTLYHRNVTVRNCYFDQGWVATLNHVDNFVFENNTSNGKMMISANACGERLNTGAFK